MVGVKTKGRKGSTIDVAIVPALESIVNASTCGDFYRREFKIKQLPDTSRAEREFLVCNICENPRRAN